MRYESNLKLHADSYYDTPDWLIIIDYYAGNFNGTAKAKAPAAEEGV